MTTHSDDRVDEQLHRVQTVLQRVSVIAIRSRQQEVVEAPYSRDRIAQASCHARAKQGGQHVIGVIRHEKLALNDRSVICSWQK